jgi:hypothetical protein
MIFGYAQFLLLIAVGAFWVFVLWMLWKIVQALKGIDESIKEIARTLIERS